MKKVSLTFISFALWSMTGYATTGVVTNSNDSGANSLRELITNSTVDTILFDAATNGDTIKLTTGELDITRDLVIIGNDSTNTIISGNKASRVIEKGFGINLILRNLQIVNGTASDQGAGIYSSWGDLKLYGVLVKNCTANGYEGGGIYVRSEDDSLVIVQSTIMGNSTTGTFKHGGGAYISSMLIRIDDSQFIGNSIENSQGGGLYIQSNSRGIVHNTTITQNSTTSTGGGMYLKKAVDIIGCNITHNTSSSSGGGIYSDDTLHLSKTTVSYNQSTTLQGGGLFLNEPGILDSCMINHNTSQNSGGGIYNQVDLQMTATTLSHNNSSLQGGGVYNGQKARISNSIISDNMSSNGGGGIYNNESLIITNSLISTNQTTNNGGGIYSRDSITLTNVTIAKNSSNLDGAGIYYHLENNVLVINNTLIALNDGREDGDIYPRRDIIVHDNGFNLIGDSTNVGSFFSSSTLMGSTASPQDPLFTCADTTGGVCQFDFTVRSNSPAIDMGSPDTTGLHLGATDISGMSRVVGGRVDIGAYEKAGLQQSNPNNDCSQSTLTVDQANLTSSGDSTYLSTMTINASGELTAPTEYLFRAPDSINLLSEFTVNQGAILNVAIAPCNE